MTQKPLGDTDYSDDFCEGCGYPNEECNCLWACISCGDATGYSCYCYLDEEEDNSLVPDSDGKTLGL